MQEILQQKEYLNYLEEFISENRKELFKKILQQRTKFFTVACEDVYQLHNTSAIMRSCEAFGIQELHVIEEKFGKRIDKEIAMGAQKWVDIFRYNSSEICIKNLKQKGYKIIATSLNENAIPLNEFKINQPCAFIFGTEKAGLSDNLLSMADAYLKIPMYGFTSSLNVSVSAAIILQNITEKLKNSKVKWQLTEEELVLKQIDWTKKSIKDIDFIEKKYLENYIAKRK